MSKGTKLNALFSLRKNFTIIALTGRHGSQTDIIAQQLSLGFDSQKFENPKTFDLSSNSYKKYSIVYRYAEQNFKAFKLIRYRHVITWYLLWYPFHELIDYLKKADLSQDFDVLKTKIASDFSKEIKLLLPLKEKFESYREKIRSINLKENPTSFDANHFCELFFSSSFQDFSNEVHSILQSGSFVKHNILVNSLTVNIRKIGFPYKSEKAKPFKVFSIAKLINGMIKAIRKNSGREATKIVIDSMQVPFEIMFFKQRYAAFYLIAVNRDDNLRVDYLKEHYKDEYDNIKSRLEDEYTGGKGKDFFKSYVRECIEKADIHITNRTKEETEVLNRNVNGSDYTSPYYSWMMQLLKYVSLIDHPGIITPSPEERCMQLAFTAKYNSGCISRQVGAAITDGEYSVKAIGWNNPPTGQVPCLIRNAETLLEATDELIEAEEKKNQNEDINQELFAFTPYEKSAEFRNVLKATHQSQISENKVILEGRNICFCFKTLKNSFSEGKNQVHTRSLHAEESAFLQITKYGGSGIQNGKLFSTASPCELCSKKAYQLGIKVIYYVDPYPGISQKQILDVGTRKPELRLFNGAVGNAYIWLYEPFMSYKDEMSLLLGLDIQDLTSQQKSKIDLLTEENLKLKKELEEAKKVK